MEVSSEDKAKEGAILAAVLEPEYSYYTYNGYSMRDIVEEALPKFRQRLFIMQKN